MKQEYIDKLAEYQKPAYEALLKEKDVLDAKQFLDSSLLYFSYATMTARLYEDAGKWNIDQIRADPTYNVIEVFGNAYDHALFCQGGKRRNVKIFIQTYSL